MRQSLLRAAIVVAMVLISLLGTAWLLPPQATVERQVTIAAPAATVFALVNGYRRFDDWSPWAGRDPQMKVERSGPDFGVGAAYRWSGNEAVGSGSQEITFSEPYREVRMKLAFADSPLPSTASFRLAAAEQGTELSWTLAVELGNNPLNRYFGLLFDRMVGPDYEAGLAKLKALAESLPAVDIAGFAVESVDSPAQAYLYVASTAKPDAGEANRALDAALAQARALLARSGIAATGPALAVIRQYDPDAGVFAFEAGYPVAAGTPAPAPDSPLSLGQLPATRVLRSTHVGPYQELAATYAKFVVYATAYGYRQSADNWEQYLDDPATTAPEALRTVVSLPVR